MVFVFFILGSARAQLVATIVLGPGHRVRLVIVLNLTKECLVVLFILRPAKVWLVAVVLFGLAKVRLVLSLLSSV